MKDINKMEYLDEIKEMKKSVWNDVVDTAKANKAAREAAYANSTPIVQPANNDNEWIIRRNLSRINENAEDKSVYVSYVGVVPEASLHNYMTTEEYIKRTPEEKQVFIDAYKDTTYYKDLNEQERLALDSGAETKGIKLTSEQKKLQDEEFKKNIESYFEGYSPEITYYDPGERLNYLKPSQESWNEDGSKKYSYGHNENPYQSFVIKGGFKEYSDDQLKQLAEQAGITFDSKGKNEREEIERALKEKADEYNHTVEKAHQDYDYGDTYEEALANWQEQKDNDKIGKIKIVIPYETYEEVIKITYDADDYHIVDQTSEIVQYAEDDSSGWIKDADGKWWQNILGSAGDASLNFLEGVGGIGEGIFDFGTHLFGLTADVLGYDKAAENIREFAQRDLVDEGTDWIRETTNLEDYSVFGDKSDAVAQGLGYASGIALTAGIGSSAGLGTVGTTALTSTVSGISSAGSGINEAYASGATTGEAWGYGLSKGGVTASTELLFGGLGKGANAVGISRGVGSIDDIVANGVGTKLANAITKNPKLNKVIANTFEGTVKAGGEGLEEVIEGYLTAHLKKGTYLSEKDFDEILTDENLLEQFVNGMIVSGIMQSPSVVGSTVRGTDFVDGLTTNEQKVLDVAYENAIADAENDGTKLTAKEKSKLYEDTMNSLQRGEIDTPTIEAAIGGEAFKEYQAEQIRQENVLNQLAKVYQGEELQSKRESFLAASKAKLDALKSKVNATVSNLINSENENLSKGRKSAKRTSYLSESYNEREREKSAFSVDFEKYDKKYQPTIKKAVESGILNNTRKTHEFVDFISKISADKGVSFAFTNNEKIKGSSFALNGKTVNGYVNGDTIGLNVDEKNALYKTVGHEITHVLEGTEFYNALVESVTEYAKSKKATDSNFANEYIERLRNTYELYQDVEGYQGAEGLEKIHKEVIADLVGEYLFTDTEFIMKLSVEKPNLFIRIFQEIKYLCKIATAGSIEGRQLEKVKKAFEDAYRNSGKTQKNTTENSGVKYSIVALENGNVYVQASRKVINGTRVEEMRKDISRFFSDLLEGNSSLEIPTIHGDVLTITKAETADKARDNYNHIYGKRMKMSDEEFAVKMRVASHIDEVSEISSPMNEKDDYKDHSFAKDGFTYRKAYFRDFDGQYYEITLSIGNNGKVATVYNIGKIKESVLPSAKILAVVGSKPLGKSLSYDNMPQNTKNVNAHFFEDAYRNSGKAQKNTAPKNGVKYSLSETTDGRIVAVVDNDILSKIDTTTWNKTKKDMAQKAAVKALKQFQTGIVVEGITRKVNRTSRREYTRSNDTEYLYQNSPDVFADKMRAADIADDIVIATTNWIRDGRLTHQRSDRFIDFDHGTTLIAAGNAKYIAEVVVGITESGEAVFYDVVDMKPTIFDIKKAEISTTATTQNAIGDINEISTNKKISQSTGKVNSPLLEESYRNSGKAQKNTDNDVEKMYVDRDELVENSNRKLYNEKNELNKFEVDALNNIKYNDKKQPVIYMKEVTENEDGKYEQFHSQKRSEVVQPLSKSQSWNDNLQNISNENTEQYFNGRALQPISRKERILKYPDRDNDVRFSIAGEKSKTANQSLLFEAKLRAYKGEDGETIRKATGWYKGRNGKWRYYIPDNELNIDRLVEFANSDKSVALLGEVITHDRLFAAYPELRNVRIGFIQLKPFETGVYRYHTNAIILNKNLIGDEKMMADTIIHEIQHAIQIIEGFARGGNEKTGFYYAINTAYDTVNKSEQFNRCVTKEKKFDFLCNIALNLFDAKSLEELAYRAYSNIYGEAEARQAAEYRRYDENLLKLVKPSISGNVINAREENKFFAILKHLGYNDKEIEILKREVGVFYVKSGNSNRYSQDYISNVQGIRNNVRGTDEFGKYGKHFFGNDDDIIGNRQFYTRSNSRTSIVDEKIQDSKEFLGSKIRGGISERRRSKLAGGLENNVIREKTAKTDTARFRGGENEKSRSSKKDSQRDIFSVPEARNSIRGVGDSNRHKRGNISIFGNSGRTGIFNSGSDSRTAINDEESENTRKLLGTGVQNRDSSFMVDTQLAGGLGHNIIGNEKLITDTAVPEKQHAIQIIEGFARGGKEKTGFYYAINTAYDTVNKSEQFNRCVTKKEKFDFLCNIALNLFDAKSLEELAYRAYSNIYGEAEARQAAEYRRYDENLLKLVKPSISGNIINAREENKFFAILKTIGYTDEEIDRFAIEVQKNNVLKQTSFERYGGIDSGDMQGISTDVGGFDYAHRKHNFGYTRRQGNVFEKSESINGDLGFEGRTSYRGSYKRVAPTYQENEGSSGNLGSTIQRGISAQSGTKLVGGLENNVIRNNEYEYDTYFGENLYDTRDDLKPTTLHEWQTFCRCFANKTTGITESNHKIITIFTAENYYVLNADGYMSGKILYKHNIDEYEYNVEAYREKERFFEDDTRTDVFVAYDERKGNREGSSDYVGDTFAGGIPDTFNVELDEFIAKHSDWFANNRKSFNDYKRKLKATSNDEVAFSMPRDYSYESLISKPDIKITQVDNLSFGENIYSRKEIIDKAVENAKSVGRENENGNAVVYVKDIDAEIVLSESGLRHGLDRRIELLAPIVLKSGEILKNSIRINELSTRDGSINNSYVLIGVAKNIKNEPYIISFVVNKFTNNVSSIDILYAINAKTEPAGSLSPSVAANIADYFTDSTISISKLLKCVNRFSPDILPESVLRHFGYNSRTDGKLGESALFSMPIGKRKRVANNDVGFSICRLFGEDGTDYGVGVYLDSDKLDDFSEKERTDKVREYIKNLGGNFFPAFDNVGNEWDVWTTYIQDKENTIWKAKLKIANTTNGEKVLYDVHPIEKVGHGRTLPTILTENIILRNENDVNTVQGFKTIRAANIETFDQGYVNNLLDSFGITKLGDYIHVQKCVMDTLEREGFFVDKEKRCTRVKNLATGMIVEINKSGIRETFNLDNYARLGKFKKLAKLATIREIKTLIQEGKLIADNVIDEHNKSGNKNFAYFETLIFVDKIPMTVKLSVKKSQSKNKLWVHSIYTKDDVSDSLTYTDFGVPSSRKTTNINNSDDQNVISPKEYGTFNRIVRGYGDSNISDNAKAFELDYTEANTNHILTREKEHVNNNTKTEIFEGLGALTALEMKYTEQICGKLGVKVVFGDLRDMVYNGEIISPDGYIDKTGTIHLNTYAENPIGFVLKHELAHYCENASGYEKFVNAVVGSSAYAEWIKSKTNKQYLWEAEEAYRKTVYESQNGFETINDIKIDNEIIADFVGEMLFTDNGSGIVSLTASLDVKQRNAFVQFVIDFINWVKKKLFGQNYLLRELSALQDGFSRLLIGTKTEYSNSEKGDVSDISFCFVRCKDEETISKADDMLNSGADNTQIYDELGVFKNVFGEWASTLDLRRYIFYPYGNHSTSYNLIKKSNHIEGVLRDIVIWPELYENFPEFENVKIIIKDSDNPRDTIKFIPDGDGKIFINEKLLEDYATLRKPAAKIEMLKAIQKMIQLQEGNYIGNSYDYWKGLEKNGKLPYSNTLSRYLNADDMMKLFIDNYDANMAVLRYETKNTDMYTYGNNTPENDTHYNPYADKNNVVKFDDNDELVIVGEEGKKTSKKNPIISIKSKRFSDKKTPEGEMIRAFNLLYEKDPRKKDYIKKNKFVRGGDSDFLKKTDTDEDVYTRFKRHCNDVSGVKIASVDTIGRRLKENANDTLSGSFMVNDMGQPISGYAVSSNVNLFGDAQLGAVLTTIDGAVERYNRKNGENDVAEKPHCFEYFAVAKKAIYLDSEPYELSVKEVGRALVEKGIISSEEYLQLTKIKSSSHYNDLAMKRLRAKIFEAGYDSIVFKNQSGDLGSSSIVLLERSQLIPVAKDGMVFEGTVVSDGILGKESLAYDITSAKENTEQLAKYLQEMPPDVKTVRKQLDSRIKMAGSGFLENKELGVEEIKENINLNSKKEISDFDEAGRRYTRKAKAILDNCAFKNEKGQVLVWCEWNTKPKNIPVAVKNGTEFATANAAFEKFFAHKEENYKCYNGVFEEIILNCSSPLVVKLNGWNTINMARYLLKEGIITKKYYKQIMYMRDIESPTYNSFAAKELREKIKTLGYDCIVFSKDTGEKTAIPFYEEQVITISKNGILNEDCMIYDIEYNNESASDDIVIDPKIRTTRNFSSIKEKVLLETNITERINHLTNFINKNNEILSLDENVGYSGDFEKGKADVWRLVELFNKLKANAKTILSDFDTAGRKLEEKVSNILGETILKDGEGRPLSFFIFNKYKDNRFKRRSLGYRLGTLTEACNDYLAELDKHPSLKKGQFEEYLVDVNEPYIMKSIPKDFTNREFALELYQNSIIDETEYQNILAKSGADTTQHSNAANRIISNLKACGYDSIIYMNKSGSIGVIPFEESQLVLVSVNGEKQDYTAFKPANSHKVDVIIDEDSFDEEFVEKKDVNSFDKVVEKVYTENSSSEVKEKKYAKRRPRYTIAQIYEVWKRALMLGGGSVYDPSGAIIIWDRSKPRNGQWDMGHIPEEQYALKHKEYMDGKLTDEEFEAWYQNRDIYRPELPSTNRGHKFEKVR